MSASEAQSSSRPQTAEWVPLGLRCGLDLVYKDDAVATLFANLSGPSTVSSSSSSSSSSAKFVEESEFFRECCGIDAKAMHRDELEKGSLLAPISKRRIIPLCLFLFVKRTNLVPMFEISGRESH